VSLPASTHTYGTLDSNLVVESGETVSVFGIYLSNFTGGTVEYLITESDLTTPIMNIVVTTNQAFSSDVKFLADNGIAILSLGDANATATIFHSAAGI
jgi:hypothetical protein